MEKISNKKSVLIADHEHERLSVLGKQLRFRGYVVLVATDGKQALGIVRSKRPDLLVVVSHLPIVDGIELCRVVKADTKTKVIVVSIEKNIDEKNKAVQAGANVVLPGFDVEELLEAISEIFKKEMQAQKILVVEDNQLNQNYILATLEEAGYVADLTDNGQTALQKIEQENYALVLTDVNVLALNGIELVKKIRAYHSQSMPVIAISGHSDKQFIDNCLAAGMNAFVTKPFSSAQLIDAINKALINTPHSYAQTSEQNKKTLANMGRKTYNYTIAVEVAKGDEDLLQKWIVRFKDNVKEALQAVNEVVEKDEYPERLRVFHDMLNYSNYYGLDDLADYIRELHLVKQHSHDKERIGNFYRKIKNELKSISDYYDSI